MDENAFDMDKLVFKKKTEKQDNDSLRYRPWTYLETKKLRVMHAIHSHKRWGLWNLIAAQLPGRNPVSVRQRAIKLKLRIPPRAIVDTPQFRLINVQHVPTIPVEEMEEVIFCLKLMKRFAMHQAKLWQVSEDEGWVSLLKQNEAFKFENASEAFLNNLNKEEVPFFGKINRKLEANLLNWFETHLIQALGNDEKLDAKYKNELNSTKIDKQVFDKFCDIMIDVSESEKDLESRP